jgi:hypothetical protein
MPHSHIFIAILIIEELGISVLTFCTMGGVIEESNE